MTTDLIGDGLAFLAETQSEAMAIPATYRRLSAAGFVDVPVTVTVDGGLGGTMGDGVQVQFSDLDAIIAVDQLKVAGVPFNPARGDRLAITMNGQARTYEALPLSDRGKVFEPALPPYHLSHRIHFKLIT